MALSPIPVLVLSSILAQSAESPPRFEDQTELWGLGKGVIRETVGRLCFADLNNDGWPDAVINRHRVFLNVADPAGPSGRRFSEVDPATTGLDKPLRGTATVFVDLDNDGNLDAVVTESLDALDPEWVDPGRRSGWHRGHGDGTYGPRVPLPVDPKTTISIAAGDVNLDGLIDLYLGNAYQRYGQNYEGFTNDLLLSVRLEDVEPGTLVRVPLPEDAATFDPETDQAGSPTYGTMIAPLAFPGRPLLLDMSYGRRWNRAWLRNDDGVWQNVAKSIGWDGDDIRHGRHPEWLKERAKTDPRFDRADEPPFRANGNSFDASIADVNNDGLFDIFIGEITHGWAGDSSDRSRFLLQKVDARTVEWSLVPDNTRSVDRVPSDPNHPYAQRWNQGDMHCALADINNDGLIDLVLSSGDYPDDQRLRIYLQQADGSMKDATSELGIDHDGSQQISLADIDADGDLDILIGQTFNRMTKEQREGRTPGLKLFVNEASGPNRSLVLRLKGDGKSFNRQGLGAWAMVRFEQDGEIEFRKCLLVGAGGHAGKQHDFIVHFGLGTADHAKSVTVDWPDGRWRGTMYENLKAGHWILEPDGTATPWSTEAPE